LLSPLGDAVAASLGLPTWAVEVIGVRDVARRRLLAGLVVDFRILAATAADAAALQQQVASVDLQAVAAPSGLPIVIESATAAVVQPPELLPSSSESDTAKSVHMSTTTNSTAAVPVTDDAPAPSGGDMGSDRDGRRNCPLYPHACGDCGWLVLLLLSDYAFSIEHGRQEPVAAPVISEL
jgi:hypothetical protein